MEFTIYSECEKDHHFHFFTNVRPFALSVAIYLF